VLRGAARHADRRIDQHFFGVWIGAANQQNVVVEHRSVLARFENNRRDFFERGKVAQPRRREKMVEDGALGTARTGRPENQQQRNRPPPLLRPPAAFR
jgi:hypothetical protein